MKAMADRHSSDSRPSASARQRQSGSCQRNWPTKTSPVLSLTSRVSRSLMTFCRRRTLGIPVLKSVTTALSASEKRYVSKPTAPSIGDPCRFPLPLHHTSTTWAQNSPSSLPIFSAGEYYVGGMALRKAVNLSSSPSFLSESTGVLPEKSQHNRARVVEGAACRPRESESSAGIPSTCRFAAELSVLFNPHQYQQYSVQERSLWQ